MDRKYAFSMAYLSIQGFKQNCREANGFAFKVPASRDYSDESRAKISKENLQENSFVPRFFSAKSRYTIKCYASRNEDDISCQFCFSVGALP